MRKMTHRASAKEPETMWSGALNILKCSLVAIIITLITFLIFAVIIKVGDMQENVISPVVQVIRTLSIAFGGMSAARTNKKRGWLKGAITGVVYILWAFIISSLLGDRTIMHSLILSDILLGIVAGAVGGIIGVNL